MLKIWAVFNTIRFYICSYSVEKNGLLQTIIPGYLTLSFVELTFFTTCFTFMLSTCYNMLHKGNKYIHKKTLEEMQSFYKVINLFLKIIV